MDISNVSLIDLHIYVRFQIERTFIMQIQIRRPPSTHQIQRNNIYVVSVPHTRCTYLSIRLHVTRLTTDALIVEGSRSA